MGAPNKKRFTCTKCGKNFDKSGNFNRHVKSHSSMKPHRCPQCKRCFDQKSNLERHMKHHDNMKSFECKQCNKGFTTAWGLKLHVRIHEESKPYNCSKCKKCFRQSSHLQEHKRTHSRQKPKFKCNKCDKSFNQSSNLQQHIKELHGLKEHPHTCSQCQQTFSRASYLQIHQRIHSGVKPLRCEHCGKSFRFLSSLYRHCRSHLCDEENGDVFEGSILKDGCKGDLKATPKECTRFEDNCGEECSLILLKQEETEATQESECWICLMRLTDPADMINHINEHCQL